MLPSKPLHLPSSCHSSPAPNGEACRSASRPALPERVTSLSLPGHRPPRCRGTDEEESEHCDSSAVQVPAPAAVQDPLISPLLPASSTRRIKGNSSTRQVISKKADKTKEEIGKTVAELECLLDLDEQCQRGAADLKLQQLVVMRERNAYLEKLREVECFCEARNWTDSNADIRRLFELLKEILYSSEAAPV
ncbi:hypothetical protein CSUI_005725 [Cystoisospora suis]|uniref:EB1 C-terminal domain-containing protein n=1 Tax=Cystoisospora suis TaxID=483139 RepID=A0A2C6KWJ7_9APIC|nr:hypothetical protein CSUI_005725 [Cystoisospora suis]